MFFIAASINIIIIIELMKLNSNHTKTKIYILTSMIHIKGTKLQIHFFKSGNHVNNLLNTGSIYYNTG